MNSFKGWSDSHWGHGECVPARQPGDAEPGGQHHPSHRLRPLWHSQWLHWAGHPVASGNFVRGHIFFMHPYGFISYFSFTCAFLLQEFYELLLELQKRLTKAIKSVGRIEHSVWRSFQRYFFKDIHYTLWQSYLQWQEGWVLWGFHWWRHYWVILGPRQVTIKYFWQSHPIRASFFFTMWMFFAHPII